MRELLGAEADEEQVRLCAMSVVHQCLAIGIHLFAHRLPPDVEVDMPTDQLVGKLARHIACFSLAGISATRENIEMEQLELPA